MVMGFKFSCNYQVFFLASMLCTSMSHADSIVIAKTKSKLKEVEAKILTLQQTLSTAHDKQGILNQELAATDIKIGIGIKQLKGIQHNLTEKQVKISELQA